MCTSMTFVGPYPIEAPDVLAEHLAGHDLAVVAHQQFEDAELGGREIHCSLVERDPLVGQAELQPSCRQRHRRLVGGAPVHGLDPREQFVHRERLDEIVIGARLEGLDLVGHEPAGRQHDYGRPHSLRTGRTQHVEPVRAG